MNLVIQSQTISQYNGLFLLNDLHKVSGGEKRHQPSNFFANQQTKELICEIEKENTIAYHTLQGKGKKQGTYACRELVYAYAMWISAKFSLMVIRAFDKMTNGETIACLKTTPQTTPFDRTPLRQAVSMLVGKKGLAYDDAYKLVHQYMGVGHIDQIAMADLPRAVAYVHHLLLDDSKKENDSLTYNAQNLAWHACVIDSWYQAIEPHFRALCPQLAGEIHDHIKHAKLFAGGIKQTIGLGQMADKLPLLEAKEWAVRR